MLCFLRFCFAAFVAASAMGHDLYLLPETFVAAKSYPVLFELHNGDSFPDSELSVAVERLRDGTLHSASGSRMVDHLHVDGNRTLGSVSVPGDGNLILGIRTIPNFIQLEPDKFLAYLQEEGLSSVIEWRAKNGESAKPGRERYSKYAKSLLLAGAPDGYFSHAVGFPIEILLEKDPHILNLGQTLPVRVMYRGEPASGLQLEAAWAGPDGKRTQIIGRTGNDGRIAIPLTARGKWRLHTIKMEHLTDANRSNQPADWESFWASFTFEIQ
ncbi:MAG: DUF4198 domain-containing protein [Bryobacteraceae bacterium]